MLSRPEIGMSTTYIGQCLTSAIDEPLTMPGRPPVRDGYLSPDVELLGFRALGRVCSACFDNDARMGDLLMRL